MNRMLLLSEQRSFRLSGQLYRHLVPLLDGTRTADGIVAALDGRADPARVRTVLADMMRKGYLARLDNSAPRDRQALWSETGLAPLDAEQALRALPIHVTTIDGADSPDARAVRTALAGAGLALAQAAPAQLTVVVVDDYLRRDLAALNQRMRGEGKAWMLVKPSGARPMFGPMFQPHGDRCWQCLALRMAEHRPGDGAVPPTVMAVRPARAGHATSRATFAGLVALQLARATAKGGLDGFADAILSLDVTTLEWQRHHVRIDPHCPVCAAVMDPEAAMREALRPLRLRSRPILGDGSDGWRTRPAAEALERLDRYVSPVTGLLADVEDVSPGNGLHVFRARQTYPVGVNPRQNRQAGRPGAAAGKGSSAIQARISCLAEAVERYACGDIGGVRRRATLAEMGDAAIDPPSLLLFSAQQLARREAWNKEHGSFNWVAEPFDPSRAIEWTPAWSLTRDCVRWLPSRFCFMNYVDPAEQAGSDNAFCGADSNGCASGSTLEEAILQGFLELVERDACAVWWYNRLRRPAFDLDAIDTPFVQRTRADCRDRGRGLAVLDLTNDLGVPTAVAVTYDLATGGRIHVGLGAHLEAGTAVTRALAEMIQMWALDPLVDEQPSSPATPGDDEKAFRTWLRESTLETEPYCVPDGLIQPAAYPAPRCTDLKDGVERCMRLVADRGHEMIVLDQSRPDIDFSVARVVVPGLRHFWARFAPGRLYDVPVALGWRETALTESELNPIPFFL